MKISLVPFPKLHTARLVLRRLVMNDCPELMRLRSDPEVNKYLNRGSSISMEEAAAHVLKIDRTLDEQQGAYWIISLKNQLQLIGAICLWNFEPEKDQVELGYELSPAYQQKGIMNEALQRVIAYAFNDMEVKVMVAATHPQNEASVKLLMRNGFKPDERHIYVSEADAERLSVYFLRRE